METVAILGIMIEWINNEKLSFTSLIIIAQGGDSNVNYKTPLHLLR